MEKGFTGTKAYAGRYGTRAFWKRSTLEDSPTTTIVMRMMGSV
jgi:hypothetical protein